MPRVALITGAARRIGRTLALRLAQAGFDIAIHYARSETEALALSQEITALGRKSTLIKADLTAPDAVSELISKAVAALGPVAVLVNNASEFQPDTVSSLTAGNLSRHMAINLTAPLLLSQAFAAQSNPPDDASIINLIDQRVLKRESDFLSYGLSKSALWTATELMAKALAPNIRVNAIGPGPVLRSVHQSAADVAHEAASTPLGLAVSPEAIADAALYLIEARHVTGQLICVDSGQHLA